MEILDYITINISADTFDFVGIIFFVLLMVVILYMKGRRTQFIRKMKFGDEPKQEVKGIVTNIKLQSTKSGHSGWFLKVESLDPFSYKTKTYKSDLFPIFGGKFKSFLQKKAEKQMKERLSDILKEGDSVKIYISPIKPKYCYINDKDLLNKLESLK